MNLLRSRLAAVIFGTLGVLWSVKARSQTVDPELVALLEAEDCDEELVQRLGKLLAIELDSLEQERGWAISEHVSAVGVRCVGERVEIEARSYSGKQARTNVTMLDSANPDRARALALTATELVDQLRAEEINRPKQPPLAEKPRALPRRELKSKPPVRTSLLLGGGLLRIGRPAVTLPTFAVTVRPRLGQYFELCHELEFGFGQADTDATAVELNAYGVATSILVGTNLGALRWGLGLGVRAGLIRMQGEPSASSGFAGERVQGVWMGLAIGGQLTLAPVALAKSRAMERFDFVISGLGEAGLVLVPLVGTDETQRTVFEIDGAWFRVTAAIGFVI